MRILIVTLLTLSLNAHAVPPGPGDKTCRTDADCTGLEVPECQGYVEAVTFGPPDEATDSLGIRSAWPEAMGVCMPQTVLEHGRDE